MINILKSQPAPECLSQQKDYKCGDVLQRLVQDFHNKCYICEEKDCSNFNVEHFKAHKGDKTLMYDWNNLFLACGHCNNIKLAKYDNLVDCTDSSIRITDLIEFEANLFPKGKIKISSSENSAPVQQTVQLLNEVYNGTTQLKTIESENICKKLQKELIDFNKDLQEYYYGEGWTEEDKQILKTKIKRKLSPESAFTAFKIWIIKTNQLNDFESYC